MKGSAETYNPRVLSILVLVSIALLTAFLVFWLYSRYNSEYETLTKDLAVKLEATQQNLSDDVIIHQISRAISTDIKPKPKDTFKKETRMISYNSLPPSERGSFRMVFKANDSLPINPNSSKKIQIVSMQQDVTLVGKDSIDKTVVRSLGSMVQRTGLFNDSIKILINDPVKLVANFQKVLDSVGYDFRVFPDSLQMKKAGIHSKPITLAFHNRDAALVTGYRPYLFRKVLPETLFSILLICITAGAFWIALRSLKEQLKLARIRNELVSNMSHELKTPVATVKVALEALGDAEVLDDRKTVRDYVSMASLETARLEQLINQALHTSLLEQGKLLVQRQPANIRDLVSEVIQAVTVRARQQQAGISTDFEGADFLAQIDKLHIQGVLFNVLDNALKYGGTKVAIHVLVRENESNISIAVSDTGPGIPSAYLGQVFDKFFRVPANNLHNVKGYGLGLSYASQVMQQHNGSIRVQNNETSGCTFLITIPKG